jgi:hypothetical protein
MTELSKQELDAMIKDFSAERARVECSKFWTDVTFWAAVGCVLMVAITWGRLAGWI